MIGAASEAAAGAHKYSSVVVERCQLCAYASTNQTSTSGVMVGSAGEAAEGIYAAGKAAAGVGDIGSASRSRQQAITSNFSIPVYTKDTLDEKGQARDT